MDLVQPERAIYTGKVTLVHFHNKENPPMALPPSILKWVCGIIETRCYVVEECGLKVNIMGEDARRQRKPCDH